MVAALRSRALHVLAALVALFALGATAASAETLMMPPRDAKMGTSVVVWGITTQANGTPYTIDFGDGSAVQSGNVGDRSYIAFNHTYAAAGKPTVTLTVGAETATVVLQVFDTTLLNADNLRSLGINMSIEDGLRWLWVNQGNRTTFDTNNQTYWNGGDGYAPAYSSFVTLAFENHGYKIQDSHGNAATDIYGKYAVRRGLNYVLSQLQTLDLTGAATTKQRPDPTTYALTTYTDDPCQGLGGTTDPCIALYNSSDSSYQTAVAILALAGSGAMNKVNTEVGGYISGKTYKEILQRMANAQVYGQNDSGTARGGWCYNFNQGCGDGSTLGWAMLGLLDAEAAGAVIPQFAKEEVKYQVGWQKPDKTTVLDGYARNNDGGIDYCADGNTGSNCAAGIEKGGIPLQGYYLTGQTAAYFLGHDPADETELRNGLSGTFANNTLNYLNNRWNGTPDQSWGCNYGGDYLRGCAYSLFNAFKGLKLTGITTMSNSSFTPATGSTLQAHDWYAEFQDYLVAHQQSPNSTGGGWFPASWSCCDSSAPAIQAIAELVLSPVALVLPDADKFSTVGLTHVVAGVDSIAPDSATEGGTHTVTANALSSNNTPVAGATVVFTVVSGPNAGATGSGNTNSSGKTSFTYSDPLRPNNGSVGQDVVQAAIGSLTSNQVIRNWLPRTPTTTAVSCPASVTYDTTAQMPCTATTFVTADPTTILVASAPITYANNTDPGTASASASYAGTAQYGPSSGETDFSILKADAVITVNGYTGVYDGLAHGATGSATGVGGVDLAAELSLGASFTAVPGGTANWTFAGDQFYNAASGSVAITITPRPATVTANSTSKVYGTTVTFAGTEFTAAGFLSGDSVSTVSLSSAGAAATAYAGSYPISASNAVGTGVANYSITYVDGTLTVTKRAASVTPADNSKEYGSADPALTGTLAGFLPGDNVTATYARGTGEHVGTYDIHGNLAPNPATDSYDVTYNLGHFTITKKAASVTVNAATKEYGSADPAFTGTLTGFIATDNVTATYSRTPGETVVGTYTISASLSPLPALDNYAITYNTAAFTITPKAASVTPNAASKVYGSADPALTGSTAGFLASDNVVATFSRVAGELVGNYTISASLAPAGVLSNYTITSNTAVFTITKHVTTTTITSGLNPAASGPVTFTAQVAPEVGPAPTTGTVTFYDGTTVIGTGTVNASGVATLTTSSLSNGYHTISASYSGDANYEASSTTQSVNQLVYAFPGANGGTFVVGDLNAAPGVGATVAFWGAQWEKQNAMTGGASNASFKGYANAVALGARAWATDPGNSSVPPAAVADYIGIIVTNKVNKAGANISGAIVKIVVVKTNAGYAGDPGHAGTGTIVAVAP